MFFQIVIEFEQFCSLAFSFYEQATAWYRDNKGAPTTNSWNSSLINFSLHAQVVSC